MIQWPKNPSALVTVGLFPQITHTSGNTIVRIVVALRELTCAQSMTMLSPTTMPIIFVRGT